jgi:hypothetical protein
MKIVVLEEHFATGASRHTCEHGAEQIVGAEAAALAREAK